MRRNKLYGLDKSDTMGFRTYHIEVKAILQYVHEMVTPVHEASFKDTSTTGSVTTLPLPLLPRLFRPSCRRRDENPGKVCWPLTVNAARPRPSQRRHRRGLSIWSRWHVTPTRPKRDCCIQSGARPREEIISAMTQKARRKRKGAKSKLHGFNSNCILAQPDVCNGLAAMRRPNGQLFVGCRYIFDAQIRCVHHVRAQPEDMFVYMRRRRCSSVIAASLTH